MSIVAHMSRHYRIRLALIGGMLVIFSGWCLYDGFIVYPAQKEQWDVFYEISRDASDWRDQWRAETQKRGWAYTDNPKQRTDKDIMTQFLMAGLLLPPGLLLLGFYVASSRRWVGMDEEGLQTSAGARVKWDDIVEVDTTRWQTKGIARVVYRDAQGQNRRLTLDDWKYNAPDIQRIYEAVHAKTGLGEPPQPPPAADAAASD